MTYRFFFLRQRLTNRRCFLVSFAVVCLSNSTSTFESYRERKSGPSHPRALSHHEDIRYMSVRRPFRNGETFVRRDRPFVRTSRRTSVGPSVRLSVRPSVRPSLCPSLPLSIHPAILDT